MKEPKPDMQQYVEHLWHDMQDHLRLKGGFNVLWAKPREDGWAVAT